ncbi:YigZ family protein [Roseateles sp. DAIF2]|uniref:IMPACT family protein n=1 Tax=Roseateles sp. DAIF2 TaxID=2714952 RepID=UPI0018A30C19|nr:YigZ family protein [Roseateles sp. DAIF2]QPF71696.1 YigZ family protein [Roseateles sp. DAIF2]
MPLSLARPVDSDLLIKKSRFLGRVEPCAGREAALERVAALRAEHPGAAHVCWALLAGGQSAANDDGEPGGTAGRPMLEVLRHQDLEGVLATVVRYFGGVKLGAGGLVRAYTDAVAQALLGAEKVPLVRLVTLRCTLPYALEGLARRELELAGAQLLEVRHGAQVEMRLALAEDAAAAFRARLSDAGQGRIGWFSPEDGPAL